MMSGILAAAAVLGVIVLVVVLLLQRGRDGVDFGAPALLRLYLYIASLAGVIVFAVGLASVVNYGIARVAGDEFVYGGSVAMARPFPVCPPGAEGCKEPTADELARQKDLERQQRERQRNEDLLRGLTFATFGAIFWGAHWAARRGLGAEGRSPGLHRGYLLLGTVVFGVATIVMLPTGVYQILSNALLTTPEGSYRPGADALGGGLVVTPIWLIYLRLAVTDLRRAA